MKYNQGMINTRTEYNIYIFWIQDSFKTQTHMAVQIFGILLEKGGILKEICNNSAIEAYNGWGWKGF